MDIDNVCKSKHDVFFDIVPIWSPSAKWIKLLPSCYLMRTGIKLAMESHYKFNADKRELELLEGQLEG